MSRRPTDMTGIARDLRAGARVRNAMPFAIKKTYPNGQIAMVRAAYYTAEAAQEAIDTCYQPLAPEVIFTVIERT